MADQQREFAEIVDELTNRRRLVQRVPYWDASRNKKFREHVVNLPALLDQLAEAAFPGSRTGDDGSRRPPGSRPPLNLDAVDRWQSIVRDVTRWLNRLDLAGRDRLADDLRHLAGIAGRLPSGDLALLVVEASSWKVWAEVAAHERGTSWTPDAPCPCCEKRNALRVRPDSSRAYCARCEATWDEDSIGILARHISEWSKANEGMLAGLSSLIGRRPRCSCACHRPGDGLCDVEEVGGCGPAHFRSA